MLLWITLTGASEQRRKARKIKQTKREYQVSWINRERIYISQWFDHEILNQDCAILGRSDHHSHTSSTHEDIIELQDVRMSPIASLRNRNYTSDTSDNLDLGKFPPSFRITRSHNTSARSGLRYRATRNSHRPKMLHALKRGASVIRASMPKIKDVNIIDEYSRVIFPVAFLAFNVAYWVFYVVEW